MAYGVRESSIKLTTQLRLVDRGYPARLRNTYFFGIFCGFSGDTTWCAWSVIVLGQLPSSVEKMENLQSPTSKNWPLGQVGSLPKSKTSEEPSETAKATLKPVDRTLENGTSNTKAKSPRPSPRMIRKQLKPLNNTALTEDFTERSKEREKRISENVRYVNRRDMQDLKAEVFQALQYEKSMQREMHARNSLTQTIMIQCLKLADLYEEGEVYRDVLNKIGVKIDGRNNVLNERVSQRQDLEKQNDVLRNEITKLQSTLENVRQSTIDAGGRHEKVNMELKKQVGIQQKMTRCAQQANSEMHNIRDVMLTAEQSMIATIDEIKDDSLIVPE